MCFFLQIEVFLKIQKKAENPWIARVFGCGTMRKKVQEIVAYKTQKPVSLAVWNLIKTLIFQGFPVTIKYGFCSEFSPCSLLWEFWEFLDKMCRCDGMVDVADSKSAGGDSVWVRVPPPAPLENTEFFHSGKAQYFLIFSPILSSVLPREARSFRPASPGDSHWYSASPPLPC